VSIPERFSGAEDALHATASAASGLSDFGPDSYRTGLGQFLQALDDGPRFAPGGREFVWQSLVGLLVSRLQLQEGLRQQPEVLQQPIRRPLIITGVPRTGTTALHKLLSVDEQFQGLEKWLTVFPQPRPPRDSWATNPHYQATAAGLEAFFAAAPQMRAAHNIVADEVDECLELLKQDFCSNLWGSSYRVPGYDRWWQAQSELPSYRRYADALRLIGANEPDKRWLLKNPGHIMQLDALLEVFPDACVVQTHRDPVKALPSLCSVLVMARGITEGRNIDLHEIGRRESDMWAAASEAAMAARERLPDRFIDVRHADFHADPMGVVRRIYAHFDIPLSAATEARMQVRIADNPEGRHGSHDYTAAQFGLDPAALRRRFARSIDQYHLA
jgi:hypothetical protein